MLWILDYGEGQMIWEKMLIDNDSAFLSVWGEVVAVFFPPELFLVVCFILVCVWCALVFVFCRCVVPFCCAI